MSTIVDRFIWLSVMGLVSFVIGFLFGQAHQVNIFEEAVEKAHTRTIESRLGNPTTPREAKVLHMAPSAQLSLQVVPTCGYPGLRTNSTTLSSTLSSTIQKVPTNR